MDVLAEKGPSLGRPYVDTVKASKYSNMKELRIQHGGRPYRIFFIFDPKQTGILLIGAVKSGTRFYRDMVPQADKIYAQYLREMGGS